MYSERFFFLILLHPSCEEEMSAKCYVCYQEFGFWRPEDYCRVCNKYYCKKCAPQQIIVPAQGAKPVRVCNTCVDKIQNPASVMPMPKQEPPLPNYVMNNPKLGFVPPIDKSKKVLASHSTYLLSTPPTGCPVEPPNPAYIRMNPSLGYSANKSDAVRDMAVKVLRENAHIPRPAPVPFLPPPSTEQTPAYSKLAYEIDRTVQPLLDILNSGVRAEEAAEQDTTLQNEQWEVRLKNLKMDSHSKPALTDEEILARVEKLRGDNTATMTDEELVARFTALHGFVPVAFMTSESVEEEINKDTTDPAPGQASPMTPSMYGDLGKLDRGGEKLARASPSPDSSVPKAEVKKSTKNLSEEAMILQGIKDEILLERRHGPSVDNGIPTATLPGYSDSMDIPCCSICEEDAVGRCNDGEFCENDLFCKKCFREVHTEDKYIKHHSLGKL